MELNELQQLIASMEASGLHSLELRRPGERLKLTLIANDAIPSQPGEVTVISEVACPSPTQAGITVRTEAAGLFLASHPMRTSPLTQVGATVKQNEVVGLLKIGPIYAPISAPVDGVVSQIYATEGTLLGYGAPVLEISSTANPL